MKIRNLGKKLSIIFIILALLVTSMFVIIINIIARNNRNNDNNIGELNNQSNTLKISNIYYDERCWPKENVKQIVDNNVPIPYGFDYYKGNKENGIVVKGTSGYMMWIPYDESANIDSTDKYYQKCKYKTIDADKLESIELYGGFYINLAKNNQIEDLKDMTETQYIKGLENAKKIYEGNDKVESHLIYKEELAQIFAYENKIGKKLINISNHDNNAKIEKLNYTKNNISITKISEDKLQMGIVASTINSYSKLPENKNTQVATDDGTVLATIPSGFSIATFNGRKIDRETVENTVNRVIKIKDNENENLVYVWVPVNEKIDELKQKLAEYYSNVEFENGKGTYMYNWEGEDPVSENEYKNLVRSIEKYRGFYISEAELGYTEQGVITNRARGMDINKTNGYLGIKEGEYYRGNNSKSNTYGKIKDIANIYKRSKTSVNSHLTYGVEWDATVEWLIKNGIIKDYTAIIDSSNVEGAKYSLNLKKIKDEDVKGLNGIYGLAGNLIDLTQEVKKYDQTSQNEKVVLKNELIIGRGGSYADTGNMSSGGQPIATRTAILEDEIKKQNIGFRTCLYINIENETIEDAEGIIPKGFYYKEGTINTGMVITDDINKGDYGNEFVWVPVNNIDDISTYNNSTKNYSGKLYNYRKWTSNGSYVFNKESISTDINSSTPSYREPAFLTRNYMGDDAKDSEGNYREKDQVLGGNVKQMQNEYNEMIESVKKHGGFYISRYEISGSKDNISSKKNQNVYNNINWYEAYSQSKKMFDNSSVSTHLIWGSQWDATLNFISNTDKNYLVDSSNAGNYSKKIALTGSNENYKRNNIYDMAGNVWEWTMEAYSNVWRVYRGGVYTGGGTYYPASYRATRYSPYTYQNEIGFRVSMYVK